MRPGPLEIRQRYESGQLSKADFIAAMYEHHAELFAYRDLLRKSEIRQIEITDDEVILTTRRGVRLVCPPADIRVPPIEALNFGRYEGPEAEMLFRLAAAHQPFWDVGANVGWYTLHIQRAVPDARVFSFEPVPTTYEYLARNIGLNEAGGQVRAFNFGLGERDEQRPIFLSPLGSVASSLANLSEAPDARPVMCQLRRMDDLVREGLPAPGMIKCDVEGGELFVLRGGLECLSAAQPVIFSEMLRKWSAKHGYHPNDLISLLHGVGYRCHVIRGPRLQPLAQMTDDVADTNFVFLHESRHSGLRAELTA